MEDLEEFFSMERARARSLLSDLKIFNRDGVPSDYLIPAGI